MSKSESESEGTLAVDNSVEEVDALIRSRKKVRTREAVVSNDRVVIPMMEDWLFDDEEVQEENTNPPKKSYKALPNAEACATPSSTVTPVIIARSSNDVARPPPLKTQELVREFGEWMVAPWRCQTQCGIPLSGASFPLDERHDI
ncbi:hypothetical protein K1719_000394 [Acacia pycnantha]|nr:hypothetical protein K1719_000394 [Acacia pycnantha]